MNPNVKYIATYKAENGDTLKGIIIDHGIQVSFMGIPFLYINNFATRVPLRNIIGIVSTGEKWTKQAF